MVASIDARVFALLLMVVALAGARAKPQPEPPVDQDALRPDVKPEQEAKPQQDYRPEEELRPQQETTKQPTVDHYDQRQNGSENYRVRVDGLVFILAPADSLLLAGAALDQPNFSSFFNENKPQPKPEQEKFFNSKPEKIIEKEDFSKSTQQETVQAGHKPSLRITSLIAPFLTKFRQMQHPTK